jgi:flagellar biosynthetic protein FliQ
VAGPVDVAHLVPLAEQALLLSVAVSLPVVGALALVSLVVSVFQSTTQVTDSTLSHLPRFLVAVVVLAVLGRWMGSEVAAFAVRMFSGNA